ncbi:MAG TPA: hypothetical protein VHA57_06620 [Actinomycetota bacterium]|nr:hypothetical protein [Actinomycetota bacterium]
MTAASCPSCGEPAAGDHRRCAFDPPRFCAQCGRRLRVQVFPLEYRAACPVCSRSLPAGAGKLAAVERPPEQSREGGDNPDERASCRR